eukprot:1333332-Rhodomonas_salina.1
MGPSDSDHPLPDPPDIGKGPPESPQSSTRPTDSEHPGPDPSGIDMGPSASAQTTTRQHRQQLENRLAQEQTTRFVAGGNRHDDHASLLWR